jgi:hypothetical protein
MKSNESYSLAVEGVMQLYSNQNLAIGKNLIKAKVHPQPLPAGDIVKNEHFLNKYSGALHLGLMLPPISTNVPVRCT